MQTTKFERIFHNWVYSAPTLCDRIEQVVFTMLYNMQLCDNEYWPWFVVTTPLKISLIISTQPKTQSTIDHTCYQKGKTHLWSNQKSSRGYSFRSLPTISTAASWIYASVCLWNQTRVFFHELKYNLLLNESKRLHIFFALKRAAIGIHWNESWTVSLLSFCIQYSIAVME